MTQGYLQIHLSIQNQCLVADAKICIVTIGFFHTNWSFAGNAKITGENSSVETTWSHSWYTVTCFKQTCCGRQGLDSVFFFPSNFILVHVDNRHDLKRLQLRNCHTVINVIATQSFMWSRKRFLGTSLSTIERAVLLFSKFTIFEKYHKLRSGKCVFEVIDSNLESGNWTYSSK